MGQLVTTTPAQIKATLAYRQRRRRVELLIDPRSPESRALDRLIEKHGSQAAAVRFALLNVR